MIKVNNKEIPEDFSIPMKHHGGRMIIHNKEGGSTSNIFVTEEEYREILAQYYSMKKR